MNNLKQYLISFSGLSIGRHEFHFEADRKFFECFESSEVKDGNVKILVEFDKKSTMLELHFHISGTVKAMCDVCTDEFDLPIEYSDRLIYKFGEEEYDNTDEIVVIPHSEYEINIAQPLYEFISLAIPLRKVHPDGECNQEMIDKINEYRAKNNDDDDDSTDPRWDMLKNIKLN